MSIVKYYDRYGFERSVDFDAAVNLMDDDLREYVHNNFIFDGDDSDQDFMDMYVALHYDTFGEVFEVI